MRRLLPLALVLIGFAAAPARAEIWVVIENPNRAGQQDYYEIYDRVCDVTLPAVVVRGHGAATVSICVGVAAHGSIKIRVIGESDWITGPDLHGWSVIEAPRRPMTLNRKSPTQDDD